jgi:hypothetical protein
MIAIVIDDMGVDYRHSVEAAALPGPLTLSYLPYARDVAQQSVAARRAGHELMVHVSMQPQSRTGISGQADPGSDPGPNALTVGLPPEEIRRRLDWALGEFGATLMIAGNLPGRTQTLSVAVYSAVQAGDDSTANFLVLVTSVTCVVILLLAGRLVPQHTLLTSR